MICADCGHEIPPEKLVDIKEFENLCHDCYSLKPKHVCVDFDGVLAEYTGWKGPDHLGAPRAGVTHFLKSVIDLGFKIIILTTRNPEKVQDWLVENDLHHFIDRVTNTKPPAVVYLDDRGMCFRGNFPEAWVAIKRFVPYWREG
jgi:hypothetical protein